MLIAHSIYKNQTPASTSARQKKETGLYGLCLPQRVRQLRGPRQGVQKQVGAFMQQCGKVVLALEQGDDDAAVFGEGDSAAFFLAEIVWCGEGFYLAG